jgi:nucleoid-associated protein YgaU
MKHQAWGLFMTGTLLFTMGGCSARRDIQVRSYLQDMPRVDQKRDAGNAGYITGQPGEDPAEYKKTRKLFIWEFNRKTRVTDTEVDIEETYRSSAPQPRDSSARPARTEQVIREESTITTERIQLSDFDSATYHKEAAASMVEPVSFEDYTIEKDDTLQKIAKKFYDSYSQWTKIYDANRDRIDNPNVLKPGVTIRVPLYK